MASNANRPLDSLEVLFGNNVRMRREALLFSREELAERSHLSPQNIAKIENGDRFVTTDSLQNISRALNCTPHELFLSPKGEDAEASMAYEDLLNLLKNRSEKELRYAHSILALIFKGP